MKVRFIILLLLSCFCVMNILAEDSEKYVPKGPNATAEFEKGLYESLPIYIGGIYPKDAILNRGVLEKDLSPQNAAKLTRYKDIIETWLSRVLCAELQPKQFNKGNWLGIRKLHWDMDYIVGKFVSSAEEFPYKGTVVEFQANDRSIDLTITSPSLFNIDTNSLSDAQIRDFAGKVLNIPQEKVNKIEVEKHFITTAGVDVCNGKMQCEWDERNWSYKDLLKKEWWSYIPFWYTKGKLVLNISTIEWKKGEVPVSTKSSWGF